MVSIEEIENRDQGNKSSEKDSNKQNQTGKPELMEFGKELTQKMNLAIFLSILGLGSFFFVFNWIGELFLPGVIVTILFVPIWFILFIFIFLRLVKKSGKKWQSSGMFRIIQQERQAKKTENQIRKDE